MTRKRHYIRESALTTPWPLQDAKARFSELVRRAQDEGPQHVTVHGREAVVIVDAEEYRMLHSARGGRELVQAMQDSPHRDIDLTPERSVMPVRDIAL